MDPPNEPPAEARPLSKWLALIAVWLVGLLVWAIYLALLAVIILRLLT